MQGGDDTSKLLSIAMEYLLQMGCISLMDDIMSAKTDTELRQLRDRFVDAVLKPMKTGGGKTASVTPSPVKYSKAEAEVEVQESLAEPSAYSEHSKLKEDCLERDGFKCVITDAVDENWANKYPGQYPQNSDFDSTECAHILPQALGTFDSSNSQEEVFNTSLIWEALHRYFPALEGQINSSTIDKRENAITLKRNLHKKFGGFKLAFKPTDQENTSGVC